MFEIPCLDLSEELLSDSCLTSPDKSERGMSPWGSRVGDPGEVDTLDNVIGGKLESVSPLFFFRQFILTDLYM